MKFEQMSEQKVDMRVLLSNVLRVAKRIWLLALILVFVCAAGLTAVRYISHQPMYEANASFTVRVTNPLYSELTSYNSATATQMAKTFPSILTSGVLQKRVMEYLNIGYMPPVSVSVMENTSIITMSVRDSDPKMAYDVLNAVMTYYPEIAEFVVGFTTLTLLDESGIPENPYNSFGFKENAAKGALVGFLLWLAVVVIIALFKNTVHNEEQLKQLFSVPCIGQIPEVKLTGKTLCPIINKGKRNQSFNESVRLLRMRVEKNFDGKDNKILLVSSAIPGEGKTTVSVNLAISMAQKGKKVLLVDCDLRNPSVAKAMNIVGNGDIAAYLRGKADVRDILTPTRIESLFVITGGKDAKTESSEALNGKMFEKLLKECEAAFDLIILDTPPCSMLADASEIAELADMGLMVVRQDFASKDQILDGVMRLGDGDLPIIGCVLNVMKKTMTDGYDYGYGYGYGYGK